MAISRAQQEALNKLRLTRPSEPMATFFETLFPEAIPASAGAPLIRDAMALFEEHWTAEDGVEVPVYAHDATTLLGRTASGWRTNNARYQAASNLAAELQTKVAALEARLANPTPDDSASKTSNSMEDPSQKLHNYAAETGRVTFAISHHMEERLVVEIKLLAQNHKVVMYPANHTDLQLGDVLFYNMAAQLRKAKIARHVDAYFEVDLGLNLFP